MRHWLTGALFFLATATAFADDQPPLPVEQDVNLARYTGTWYEIARLPHFFQKGCINSRAMYDLNEDGTVSVVNVCDREDKPAKRAEGVARVVDRDTNAKLKVRFFNWFSNLFPWLTEGDYWIIHLDEEYEVAMVGAPDREYLWILARTPTIEDSRRKRLVNKARELGFPVDELVFNHELTDDTDTP